MVRGNKQEKGARKTPFRAFFLLFLKKVAKKFGGFAESSYLCTRKTKNVAPVAQLVEHLTLNQGVQGSSPCGCTKNEELMKFQLLIFLLKFLGAQQIYPDGKAWLIF